MASGTDGNTSRAEVRSGTSAGIGRDAPPILITGTHRSGSTWVGNILELAPETGYIHEPFNLHCRRGVCRAGFPYSFYYLRDQDPETAGYRACLEDTLAWRYSAGAQIRALKGIKDVGRMIRDMRYFRASHARQARPVMKDPIAFFSSEWLAANFGMQVVVIIRHPAAFVASLQAAKWQAFRYENFLGQPALMSDHLEPWRDEIVAMSTNREDILHSGILLWKIFHAKIAELQTAHPDWIFLRHEDLSRDPEAEFEALYGRLGLNFTEDTRQGMQRYIGRDTTTGALESNVQTRTVRDSRSNIFNWKKRLDEDQIAEIRTAVEPLSSQFYSDEDW